MNFTNARYSAPDGSSIDVLLDHPVHGVIPCTLRADDPLTAGLFAQAKSGSVEPFPAPSLADAQRDKLIEINAAFEAAAAALTAGYPKTETLTWPDQQREAMAWQADGNAATPFLDALAAARGIPRATYIAKTVAKINLFKAASAALVGKRQKLADQIQAATDATQLETVTW